MNKAILCEGATDSILLSYYLEKTAGWKYTRKAPRNLEIETVADNETINWYKRDDDYLLISAVGGKDNFSSFFRDRIKPPLFASNAFGRIAFVTDRDRRELSAIMESIISVMDGVTFDSVEIGEWSRGKYNDYFSVERELEAIIIVIPKDKEGALETVLLDSIALDEYDRNIVKAAGSFVEEIRSDAARYITSDALQLKAHLGVTWAVQYPGKVFSLIDEEIRSVEWEKSEVLNECLGKLVEI